METFGLEFATRRAAQAVSMGLVRDHEGFAFSEWLLSTYDGEDKAYVDAISTSVLRDRFLSQQEAK